MCTLFGQKNGQILQKTEQIPNKGQKWDKKGPKMPFFVSFSVHTAIRGERAKAYKK